MDDMAEGTRGFGNGQVGLGRPSSIESALSPRRRVRARQSMSVGEAVDQPSLCE